MCLYNIVAVAVAAHYYYSFDIVVAAAGVHECIAEIRKDIGIVAVDKTLVVAHTERTSVAPSLLLEKVSSESNIHLPHTQTRHNWKIDHHHHYHYDHLI